jgi:hypothetical protein
VPLGWVPPAEGRVAALTAPALEPERVRERTVLPLGRREAGRDAMAGGPLDPRDLVEEAGVRPQP